MIYWYDLASRQLKLPTNRTCIHDSPDSKFIPRRSSTFQGSLGINDLESIVLLSTFSLDTICALYICVCACIRIDANSLRNGLTAIIIRIHLRRDLRKEHILKASAESLDALIVFETRVVTLLPPPP